MLQLIRSHPSNESRSRAFGRPSKTLAVLELVLAQHLGRHWGPAVCLHTERERESTFSSSSTSFENKFIAARQTRTHVAGAQK